MTNIIKRLLGICLLLFCSYITSAQSFTTTNSYMDYFSKDVLSLDIIEGKWDIYSKTTAFFQGRTQSQDGSFYLYISRASEPRSFNAYYQDGKKLVYYARIEKLGSDDTYVIYLKNGHGVTNKERFTMPDAYSFSFTRRDDYGSDGSANNYFRGDKAYPTYEMYNKAIAEKKKKDTPQNCSGTGFALNSGYIVTNFHVVDGAKSILVYGIRGNTTREMIADVIATDKDNDLAILKITDSEFDGFGTIPYSIKNQQAEVGENVFVLGYPLTQVLGSEIKLTNGIISSRSGYKGDVSLYQISAPVQPGNSGGPLFDSAGNIVGIVNAGIPDADNVGYAIKANLLYSLLNKYSLSRIIPSSNSIASLSLKDQVKYVRDFVLFIRCSKETLPTTHTRISHTDSSLHTVDEGTDIITDVNDSKPNASIAKEYSTIPNGKHNAHEYVDLGLSVLWATCNVGASTPDAYGGLYAYGETKTKKMDEYDTAHYKWANPNDSRVSAYLKYKQFGKSPNSESELDLEDDAARVNWGGSWRTPKQSELQELVTQCEWKWTSINGHYGYRVKAKNGNSIFIPAAGIAGYSSTRYADRGNRGFYMSADFSYDPKYGYMMYNLFYDHSDATIALSNVLSSNYLGFSVRPVIDRDNVR